MTSRRKKGNPLATMLIISAIDVLLCSFTAGLTLFFFGSGGQVDAGQGEGWAGTLLVISNHHDSHLKYLRGCSGEPERLSASDSKVIALRLTCFPTADSPYVLGTDDEGENTVDAKVSIVHESDMVVKDISCHSPPKSVTQSREVVEIAADEKKAPVYRDGCTPGNPKQEHPEHDFRGIPRDEQQH